MEEHETTEQGESLKLGPCTRLTRVFKTLNSPQQLENLGGATLRWGVYLRYVVDRSLVYGDPPGCTIELRKNWCPFCQDSQHNKLPQRSKVVMCKLKHVIRAVLEARQGDELLRGSSISRRGQFWKTLLPLLCIIHFPLSLHSNAASVLETCVPNML
jgi:hypothetical protein